MVSLLTRSVNILNAGFSYMASSVSGRVTGHWMPVSTGIELTNYCNLRCPECLTGSGKMDRPAGFMQISLFERITAELRPYLLNINLYFQGESMMHPDFFNLIGKAGAIYTIVSTNGHFLTEENAEKLALSNLSKLIVSLDGMSAHTYSIYRKGGDFDTVIRGIEIISSAIKKRNSDLKLEIQFLVSRYNEGEIEKAKEFADKVNAQFKLKSMQIINKEEIGEWQPENKKYRRYKPENGKFRINSTLSNRCFRLWTNPVVTWDGKVVPCCFDKDASHIMGDLNISTFREIWNGEKYMEFRRSLLQGREKIDICNNCTTGLQGVKY